MDVECCKGLSTLQPCICKDDQAGIEIEKPKEEGETVSERRRDRKDLCKKCFYFNALLNILDAAPEFDNKKDFYRLLQGLPSNNTLIKKEPSETLEDWIKQT